MIRKINLSSSVLLILITLSTLQIIVIGSNEYRLVYTTHIYLLAIREGYGGVVLNTTLNIYYPGTGSVITKVENGKVAYDTITSIKYAIILASMITGVNYKLYDYEFIFPPDTRLRGPSATLEFFLAITTFYKNISYKGGVGATGVIAPNGLIGLVEGLNEKYKAGITYGLSKIIGPPTKNLTNATNYYQVIDIWNAYKIYTGRPLYEEHISIDPKYYVICRNIIEDTFRYSYTFFFNKTLELITRLEDLGVKNYESSKGYKYLVLAEKYSDKKRWYTASTYAFRAYIEIHNLLVNSMFKKHKIDAFNYIDKIGEQVHNRLQTLSVELSSSLRNITDLWDLDALINGFIRYYVALEAYSEGKLTGNPLEKAKLYILALARTYTVEHWLMLLHNNSIYGRWFSSTEYSLANIILRDYLLKSIDYLTILGIFSNKSREIIISRIPDTTGKPLETFINYTITLYDLGFITQNLKPPIFSQFTDSSIIKTLNETMNSITYYLWSKTHTLLPSSITLNELIDGYIRENESLEIIGILYSSEFSALIPYLVLVHSAGLLNNPLSITVITRTEYVTVNIPVNIYYVLILFLLATGAFLIGYGMGKTRR